MLELCPQKLSNEPQNHELKSQLWNPRKLSESVNLIIWCWGGTKRMTMDLQLKSCCSGCRSTTDLYGSNCKHMTLCLTCGKTMAENRAKCYDCGATLTRLIRVWSRSLIFFFHFVSATCNFVMYFCGDRNIMFVQVLPTIKTTLLEGLWLGCLIFQRRKVLKINGVCRRMDCSVEKLLMLCGYWIFLLDYSFVAFFSLYLQGLMKISRFD